MVKLISLVLKVKTHIVITLILLLSIVDVHAQGKVLRVGMIGLDTSHVTAFTKTINDKNAKGPLANIRVVAGYPGGTDIPASRDRVKKFTDELRGMGIEIVDSIPDLLKKVDVVLLESVDGRPHLEQVLPVLKSGKPVFVDKPVAGSLQDAYAIYLAAKHYKVPIFSSSSYRFHPEVQAIRRGSVGEVLGCQSHGPATIQEDHPDLFWYGIHTVEGLYTCMGVGCETVTRVSTPDFDMVIGKWKGGRIGSYRGLRKGKIVSGGTVFGSKAVVNYKQSGGYGPMLVEIATFFQTGKPPVSAEETLELYAFMEAADESKRQGGKPVSMKVVMDKAKAAAMVDLKKRIGLKF